MEVSSDSFGSLRNSLKVEGGTFNGKEKVMKVERMKGKLSRESAFNWVLTFLGFQQAETFVYRPPEVLDTSQQ